MLWTPTWEFGGSYVNFEEPWRETLFGYGSSDLAVDIVVTPDGSWSWKDRAEFDALVGAGGTGSSAAAAVLDDAHRVIADIDGARGQFDSGLHNWRPGRPSIDAPALPEGWAIV